MFDKIRRYSFGSHQQSPTPLGPPPPSTSSSSLPPASSSSIATSTTNTMGTRKLSGSGSTLSPGPLSFAKMTTGWVPKFDTLRSSFGAMTNPTPSPMMTLRTVAAASDGFHNEDSRDIGTGGGLGLDGARSSSSSGSGDNKYLGYLNDTEPLVARVDDMEEDEEEYVEVVLVEPLQMEFEHVFGRVVLKSVEDGHNAKITMRGVPPGSVLIGVDGELLSVESRDRLMVKVTQWTSGIDTVNVKWVDNAGMIEPPIGPTPVNDEELSTHLLLSRGNLGNSDTNSFANYDDAGNTPPVSSPLSMAVSDNGEEEGNEPPKVDQDVILRGIDAEALQRGLHLTFRLPTTRGDEGDMNRYNQAGMSLEGGRGEDPDRDAHRKVIAEFRVKVEDDSLSEGLAEHFLGMASWDIAKATAQFLSTQEEASDLLNAYHWEEEEVDPANLPPPRLVWDPAEEDPNTEFFPTFEATGIEPARAEYEVVITEPQKLGITVENVLERTVVCNVSRTSCAFRAGMEEDTLVVTLNDMGTRCMCHKEVIDRLQQMHRPLRVRLRRIAPEKLQQRRAEMNALMHPQSQATTSTMQGLESRAQTVGWAEQKLLSLVRILALSSTIKQEGVDRPEEDEEERRLRDEIWQDRVLDLLQSVELGFRRRAEKSMGVNERLRMLALELQLLMHLFADYRWAPEALRPVRWHFIDMIVQALCVDSEASLTISRDTKELADGPAIVILQELVKRLRPSESQDNTSLLLYRLAGSYSIHARVASCCLAPLVYGRLPMPQQLQIRGILTRFLTDEMPLVRSVVVETLAQLADLIDMYSIKWLFFMLETSLKDTSHRVRNKGLEICYRIAQQLYKATEATKAAGGDNQTLLQELHLHRCKLLPFVNCSAEDQDWQVRAAFAYFCPGFVDFFGEQWSTVFIDNLESLMRDPEVQVRRLAVESVPRIAENWLPHTPPSPTTVVQTATRSKERIMDTLLPGFMRLVSDPSIEVRVSVASATGKLLRLLAELRDDGHNQSMDEKVVQVMTPLMQRILHDEAPQEVALALLDYMRIDMTLPPRPADSFDKPRPSLMVPSQVELLLPAVSHLSTNIHWRLRKSIAEALPTLQVIVPSHSPLEDQLCELWAALIADKVEAVRRTAGECLCLTWHLMQFYPPPVDKGRDQSEEVPLPRSTWLESYILPKVTECAEANSCKQRLLGLLMVTTLLRLPSLPNDKMAQVWALLLEFRSDRVVNVRISLARAMEGLPLPPSPSLQRGCKETLEALCQDSDRDVRYFARKASDNITKVWGQDQPLGIPLSNL